MKTLLRSRLVLFSWFLCCGLELGPVQAWAEPLHVGTEKQLFIGPWAADGRDEYLLESIRGITMSSGEAQVIDQKMMVVDRPQEGSEAGAWSDGR